MRISGVGSYQPAVPTSSLQTRRAALEAQIFDISTCTTTPAAVKARELARLQAQKAAVDAQLKPTEPAPVVPEGSTIHVIA